MDCIHRDPLSSNYFEGERNLPEENVGKRADFNVRFLRVGSFTRVSTQSVATLQAFLRVETLTNQLLSLRMMSISKIASIPSCRPIFFLSFFYIISYFQTREKYLNARLFLEKEQISLQ